MWIWDMDMDMGADIKVANRGRGPYQNKAAPTPTIREPKIFTLRLMRMN
jgi:hypothetical protein